MAVQPLIRRRQSPKAGRACLFIPSFFLARRKSNLTGIGWLRGPHAFTPMPSFYCVPASASVQPDSKGAKVKISDHVKDVRSFAETVLPDRRPVFISHRYASRSSSYLVCQVHPTVTSASLEVDCVHPCSAVTWCGVVWCLLWAVSSFRTYFRSDCRTLPHHTALFHTNSLKGLSNRIP